MNIRVLVWTIWNSSTNSFSASIWHDPTSLPDCGKCYWVTIPIPAGDIPELTAEVEPIYGNEGEK